MKIGIVGPLDSVENIMTVVKKHYPSIEPIIFTINRTNEVQKIVDKCINAAEGILFTGCGVQAEAEKHTDIHIPYEAILRDGSSIMKAFWEIRRDDKQIDNISIDLVEENLVYEIIDEFKLKPKNIYSKPFDSYISELEYQNWHKSLYKKGKANIIITAFGSVYNELLSLNLPVYRLNLTAPLIKKGIDNLIYKIKNKEMEANQIGIQIFKVKNIGNVHKSDYHNLIISNIVEKELIVYAKKVQGSMFKLENGEYMICSTRRTLENNENLYFLQTIADTLEKENIYVCSGMGFGYTGWNAERNSKDALNMAEKEDNGTLYIIDQDKKVRGPVNQYNETSYNLVITNKKLNTISKKIGISPTYLSKLISIINQNKDEYFSADTLANYLDISERSARRIMSKIEKSGYGEVVTTAITKGVGRPKKILKINIS